MIKAIPAGRAGNRVQTRRGWRLREEVWESFFAIVYKINDKRSSPSSRKSILR
jgi:hypothetical protein